MQSSVRQIVRCALALTAIASLAVVALLHPPIAAASSTHFF